MGAHGVTAKHTPCPWTVQETTVSSNQCYCVNSGKFCVARVGYGFEEGEEPQDRPNARLIAAAPELLEALQDAIAAVRVFHGPVAWETYRDHSPEMKRWRAAIARATGEAA
jgi:hypothetical protein